MNTNKFKAGDPVIIRGVVVKNDGEQELSCLVKVGDRERWVDEENLELDTSQQSTELLSISNAPVFVPVTCVDGSKEYVNFNRVESFTDRAIRFPGYPMLFEVKETAEEISELIKQAYAPCSK